VRCFADCTVVTRGDLSRARVLTRGALKDGVVVIPRRLSTVARDPCLPDEAALLSAGMPSEGSLGAGPGAGSSGFLAFFKQHTARGAVTDPRLMCSVDQRLAGSLDCFPHRQSGAMLGSRGRDGGGLVVPMC